MDVYHILVGLKGSVMDGATLDLLKKSYQQQEQSIAQLSDENTALKSEVSALKARIEALEH